MINRIALRLCCRICHQNRSGKGGMFEVAHSSLWFILMLLHTAHLVEAHSAEIPLFAVK